MTLIDTAESYGSEELISRVIAGQRDRVFLVSKVSANHVAGNGIARACEASLTRLSSASREVLSESRMREIFMSGSTTV
jgi:diketogulonate reductase-like aldo/keto reductase